MHDLCQPIMVEASDIRGRLALFGIREVGVTDISDEELDWKDDGSSLLGCAMSGVVYQGNMRRHGRSRPTSGTEGVQRSARCQERKQTHGGGRTAEVS